jgi:hypothetical protein
MNMTVQEMAMTMLDELEVPKTFWGEAIQIVVNICNIPDPLSTF